MDALALDLVGDADHGGLGHGGVGDQGALDLRRAQAVAGDVDDIVDAAHEPDVALLVHPGAVPGGVDPGELGEIGLAEAVRIAINPAHQARPGVGHHQPTALIDRGRALVLLDDPELDARQGQTGGARLGGDGARQGGDEDAAGLGLPPGIDDGAATLADHPVIPHPGLGIDGLADGAEQAQGAQIAPGGPFVALLHQGAQGGGGGVEDVDPVFLNDLPKAIGTGVIGHALEHEAGGAAGEGTVEDVAVAGDPADIGGAPVGVFLADVEDPLEGLLGIEQVAGLGVQHALGLAGAAAGVEDEEGVLGVHGLGGAGVRDAGGIEFGIPVAIPPRDQVHRLPGAPHDQDAAHSVNPLQGLIGGVLAADQLAGPAIGIGADQHLALAVPQAIAQGQVGKAAEDHAVDGADARAGENGDGELRDHGQIDGHPVALAYPVALKDIGAAADLPVQLLVGQGAGFMGALPFPDDCRLVLAPGLQVAVQAVIGDIELPAQKPAMLAAGEVRLQGPLPGVKPVQVRGPLGPEGRRVLDAALIEFPVGRQGTDAGLGG